MEISWLDYGIIGVFLLVSLLIGLYYRKRASTGLLGFFLGNRNMPWVIAGISMVATTFAADTPLAVTELVGKSGISGNWLWWSYLAGGMLTTFFFAKLWRRAGVLTEIELIELRYSGKAAALLRGFKAVYLGLVMNVLIIGWVNLAMLTIITEFFGATPTVAYMVLAGCMVLAAVYTAISGIWGVAVTDVIQFSIAIIGTLILAIVVVGSPEVGGVAGLQAALPPETFDFFPRIGGGENGGTVFVISGAAFFAYIGVQWWASWYPGQEPGGGGYVAQRMMSTRTESGSVYATLLFQIAHYCLRPWPWIMVALACLVLYPELSGNELKSGYVRAMRDFLPTGLRGLLLAAFLGAYLSTLSTQLNWGAGYLVNDVYKRFLKPDLSEKKYVAVSRFATVLLMALGLGATFFMTSISGVWAFIIECGAGLGMVLILRWYWWRVNAWSEISATIAPFVGYALSRFVFDWEFPYGFFFTVAFTTVVWLLTTFLTRPENPETLRKFYDRVKPDGYWEPVARSEGGKRNNLLPLFVCWLASIAMTYGILFMTGKIIFREWKEAAIYGAIVLVATWILSRMMKRTSVWS